MHRSFHDAGYRFFGIQGVTDGACNCGNPECKALYKHPWFSNWQHTPDWSDDQLEVMEMSGQLDAGYGVLVRGLLVVDVDARNGGVASYAKLVEAIPEIAGAGLIVETGSGGGSKHLYFKAPEGAALMQHSEDYPGVDFKSSGFVVGPGSMHASGNRYRAVAGDPSDISDAPQALIDLLRKPEAYRAQFDGRHIDVTDSSISDMLSFISADCDHETWIKSGMAIHHATGGSGFDLWDEWSSSSSKYPGRDVLERRWHSFGKSGNPVTIGTLFHFAERAGWKPSVTFDSGDAFADYEHDTPAGATGGIDTAGVDLLRPPGFVGEVAAWLNTQGHKLRENLAVAAALVTVGNVAGLRYQDDFGMRMNLFAFCVAGSGTGKEAMLAGLVEMHVAAGVGRAMHGNFKSEQELVRNILHHQAAYYAIDEVGTVLSKVQGASKKGGAVYLEGLIGQLMSIYSKSKGRFTLTGDLRREMVKELKAEGAALQKMIDQNESVDMNKSRLESVKSNLKQIEDEGIVDPFLSMIGMTTPETFNNLVTPEFVKNGFMSRALFFEERDTNPKPRKLGEKPPLPDSIKNTLVMLATGGSFDTLARRVAAQGEPIKIQSTPDAVEMLQAVNDEFHAMGDIYKERHGMEAITTRGYELTSKVSAILAVSSGLRTAEHVRWAYKLVKSDMDRKEGLAYSNDADVRDKGHQLKAAILNRVTADHGETLAVLFNRIRKWSKTEISQAVKEMVESGHMVEKVERSRTQTVSKYYASK